MDEQRSIEGLDILFDNGFIKIGYEMDEDAYPAIHRAYLFIDEHNISWFSLCAKPRTSLARIKNNLVSYLVQDLIGELEAVNYREEEA